MPGPPRGRGVIAEVAMAVAVMAAAGMAVAWMAVARSDGCGGDNDGDESDDDRAGVMTMAPVLPANRATETCKAKTAPK